VQNEETRSSGMVDGESYTFAAHEREREREGDRALSK